MIIKCEQCNKKFDIESSLIPKKGRLLQCSSCNHKWFHKKDVLEKSILNLENEKIHTEIKDNNIKVYNDFSSDKKIKRKHSYSRPESKGLSFLNFILVFIISFIALIALLDTFKNPISLLIPNIEFILESLYETLKDVLLFIKDLF
tara:strand:+ start:125 stop:562 length:438 start_codon:yes stop_codon:yes gene_type:complete